ncbi:MULTISPECIES: glycoside hydrolase family 3 protein [unclassified Sphingobium]|uniref:glycoside hydrolase family 3 protein n=1 Tax=unclassified Sphingobium TaxID=2611147 RepID=UPI001A1BCF27|nr:MULTISPECIES: glycoside hydrolase family 3 N-terminal domain-containing protein [unclassified Sphingobium]MBG6117391.1 beta-N-acetylhexosaminidase [Sphingobium sp. JAI105]
MDDHAWVERTRDSLSVEAQIAQLFVLSSRHDTLAEADEIAIHAPGGVHRFPTHDLDAAWTATRHALERSEVPLILSGDIEGGMVSPPFLTAIPNQMGIAACDDLALSADLARIVARESRAMGYNWSFTPVVDINASFRSAIVGTRSYGSDPEQIMAQARTYVRTLQDEGVAACLKHWPGDGVDDRDQHMATTVNDLSMAEWEDSFGRIFRTLIDDGVMTVMSAHIALPAYVCERWPHAGRGAFQPASVSRLLNEDLLRDQLGFEGLIISDATVMGGLTSWMDRAEAVPAIIENGCDVFLFSRDPAADMALMLRGLREGRLSEDRLHIAVTRMLTLKAKLGLHRMTLDERLAPIEQVRTTMRHPAHLAIAVDAAARSITLVKDTQNLLPLDPQQHKRIVIIADDGSSFFSGASDRSFIPLLSALEAKGCEIRHFDAEAMPTPQDTDLLLYLVGQEATPGLGHIFLDFAKLHSGPRNAMIQFNREIPTILLSFGQPYYLYDAPNIATCINAYASLPDVQIAVAKRLMGEATFAGVSPVDAFCGKEQLRW